MKISHLNQMNNKINKLNLFDEIVYCYHKDDFSANAETKKWDDSYLWKKIQFRFGEFFVMVIDGKILKQVQNLNVILFLLTENI